MAEKDSAEVGAYLCATAGLGILKSEGYYILPAGYLVLKVTTWL
jgi:hypothetical protein